MNDRILVATDLSADADAAVREAHGRAQSADGELAVCHVIPHPLSANLPFPQFRHRLTLELPRIREHARHEVAERTHALTGRLDGGFTVLIGDGVPHAAVIEAAETWGATLLVVGRHGTSANRRLLLGNVADKVVRYAHCPVLVVRPAPDFGHVLVATDFSEPSLPAIATAAREAARLGAPVTIIHSLDLGLTSVETSGVLFGSMPAAVPPAVSEELRQTARRMLCDELARHDLIGDPLVVEGPPAAAIVAAAGRLPARLIVVGTTGRTGVARLVLGSVAEAVVRDAPCPVMVVRPDRSRHA